MGSLLFVTSSVFGAESKSRLVASELVEAWRRAHPGTAVVVRDLSAAPMPHLSREALAAALTPAGQRTPAQQRAAALADALIAEAEAADVIVFAVPMYNFTIPSTLKAWLDHVARAGRTFRYGASGPEGLLTGKKVFVVTARGGVYSGEAPHRAFDFQEPYLRAILGFVGLDDVTFIHAEGLAISPESASNGLDRARQAIGDLLPLVAAA
jgi:FMN-dependent NADH-azoreductase